MIKNIYLKIRYYFLLPFLIMRKTKIPDKSEIKKILVLRYDRIGDMVLSTGIFYALKQKYPAAFITVLASKTNRDVILKDPNVDEVLVYQGFKWFIKEGRNQNIDLAIDLFLTYELKQAFLAYMSGATYRLGFESAGREIFFNMKGPKADRVCSMREHLSELISYLGISAKDYQPQLYLVDEEKQWAKNYLESNNIKKDCLTIAVHPGGFYPSQRWPAGHFVKTSQNIIENYSAQIMLFGDKNEEELLRGIKNKIGVENVSIFCGFTIRQVISLLNQCNLFIGNNSGLLHIASALKIPTVSMMGPTDPVLWRPDVENNIVIRKNLKCSPCRKGVCTPHRCMDMITAEEVFEAVKALIRK